MYRIAREIQIFQMYFTKYRFLKREPCWKYIINRVLFCLAKCGCGLWPPYSHTDHATIFFWNHHLLEFLKVNIYSCYHCCDLGNFSPDGKKRDKNYDIVSHLPCHYFILVLLPFLLSSAGTRPPVFYPLAPAPFG